MPRLLAAWSACCDGGGRSRRSATEPDGAGVALARAVGCGFGRQRCCHREQLRHGHRLEAFPIQLIECRRHRLEGRGMNIMREHDRTGMRFLQDSTADDGWSRSLPIERIHIPDDDSITKIVMDPVFLPRRDGTVGRPHQRRALPDRGEDRVIRFLQFAAHRFVGHFAQVRMRPGMIRDLVTFADRASQDVGMVRRVLADDEKGRLHVMRREEIEQLRGEGRVRAVVECQGDIGPVDVDRIRR